MHGSVRRRAAFLGLILLSACRASCGTVRADDTTNGIIRLETANSALVLQHAPDGHLYDLFYGDRNGATALPKNADPDSEYYPPAGSGYIFEPALQVTHADGNPSTDLVYVASSTTRGNDDVVLTRIEMKDSHYPFNVALCFRVFRQEDVIESWTEIEQQEGGAVTLLRYASASPLIARADSYWLTQLCGDYAHEASLVTERLAPGTKILDSKLGVRADYYRTPSFLLSLGGQPQETQGEAYGGSLAWSGSFQFAFDLSTGNRLRVLAGINPFESAYRLEPGRVFATPSMIWTWSGRGTGQVSRNFQRWAARYGVRDPQLPRPVLLNNWELTGFNFDQAKILSVIDSAKAIGAETFLLDDGWFGTAHPRDNDSAGLGDWAVNPKKLPGGLTALSDEANRDGLRFGLWLEPEMVNPNSDLYARHPDWVITAPFRAPRLMRNQMVLDLANPAVADYVWGVVDTTLKSDPGISYVKWDCNSIVYEPGSSYLKPDAQGNQLVDYNLALYGIMEKMAKEHPAVMGMACSGGGGRVDYGVMRYFDSFWPSDNTDPGARVFIQWGYSQFFPAWTMSCHVTRSGNRSIKFAVDVALSGALGLDLDIGKLSDADRNFLAAGVALYKRDVRDLVQRSDLYRLESPYQGPRSAISFVLPGRSRAILFVYQVHSDSVPKPVKLQGLNPTAPYRIHEIDLPAGASSAIGVNDTTVSGDELMRNGIVPSCRDEDTSCVVELN